MPEPKDRLNTRSQNGQNDAPRAKRGYESQARSALHGTRVVGLPSKPAASAEVPPGTRPPEATLIEKLIAFFQEMD